jgi:glutaconyl-CoA decarboxylase
MEHSPVTTNPLIIMMINMTVVFIVLVVLMYLIKLIHIVDPTKPKEVAEEISDDEEPLVAVKSEPTPTPVPVVEEGITPEIISAI